MWAWFHRLCRRRVPIWYHPDYRLPLTSIADRTGLEPRRADLTLWYLEGAGWAEPADLRVPEPISYEALGRVHEADYLDGVTRPEELARIFGVEVWDLPVDEVLRTIRLSCGGTLAAAREALKIQGPTLNLLGGMHHAGRARGGGFCPVNDLAVAIAQLRSEGFTGRVHVLDLDAHPPDGTADCLAGDPLAWIGSLSGADWGPLPGGVDETVLPRGASTEVYLEALEALLGRMSSAELTFVIAGGDVRADDPLATLGLDLVGVQRRDARVLEALEGRASVWLPGGGYGPDAWRVLAGTAVILSGGRPRLIHPDSDPLRGRYARVAATLPTGALGDEPWITEADLTDVFGPSSRKHHRLLGFYTADGVEHALSRYGLLRALERLGYGPFRVEIEPEALGDRMRLWARSGGAEGVEHLVVESLSERQRLPDAAQDILFLHWLTLRHPLASFSPDRPALPGQEVPGLGLAREAGELLLRMALRLGLAGVGIRPAWLHVAFACRHDFHFVDAARQGRFVALLRDLQAIPVHKLTVHVAEGRVLLDGEPYAWEPELMLRWTVSKPDGEWRAAVERSASAHCFGLQPSAAPGARVIPSP